MIEHQSAIVHGADKMLGNLQNALNGSDPGGFGAHLESSKALHFRMLGQDTAAGGEVKETNRKLDELSACLRRLRDRASQRDEAKVEVDYYKVSETDSRLWLAGASVDAKSRQSPRY